MSDAGAATYPVKVIAKLLLISERRVQQLVKEGVIPKTEHGRYELAPTVQGYVRYLQERSLGRPSAPEDYHSEKARLVKLQADRAELEVDELQGKLVRADDVSKHWYDMINDCKNRLLSVPSRAAPIVSSESNAGMCQQIIDDLIRESLEELSEVANGVTESGDNTNEGDAGVEATAKANG